jgi:iron complex transport system substrate-binding protein
MRVDASKVLRRPGWRRLPAVSQGQVYVVSDETLNTPALPIAEGLERLGRIIHPELFGEPRDSKVARIA